MVQRASQRRHPSQKRSSFTVDMIQQAAAEQIADGGLNKITTNSIAERAGVSIGTFYRYFSNKDEVVAALRREHMSDVIEGMRGAVLDTTIETNEELMRRMIRANVNVHLSGSKLHRALTVDHPAVGRIQEGRVRPLEQEFGKLFTQTDQRWRHLLTKHQDPARVIRMMTAVWGLVEATTHSLVIDCPDISSAEELEEIILASAMACADAITPNTF